MIVYAFSLIVMCLLLPLYDKYFADKESKKNIHSGYLILKTILLAPLIALLLIAINVIFVCSMLKHGVSYEEVADHYSDFL